MASASQSEIAWPDARAASTATSTAAIACIGSPCIQSNWAGWIFAETDCPNRKRTDPADAA